MKEEKMMILSMLQEGKITPEEAVKLMEALEDLETPHSSKETSNNQENKDDKDKNSKILNKTLDEIGSDISSALTSVFNGLKDIGSSLGINNNTSTINLDLEKDISDIQNPIIDLRAVNGSISLAQSTENKLLIKVTVQYKNGLLDNDKEFYKFFTEGNRIVFSPIYNNDVSIRLEVSLPKKDYTEIIINSTNGKIIIDNLQSNILNCGTTNGSIIISDVAVRDINLSTKNGKIECSNTKSDDISLVTTNSSINILEVEAKKIEATTANSRIIIKDVQSDKIKCKTSNSTIDAVNISSEIINLVTSNGKIIFDDVDFNKAKEIQLVTSNGSINSEFKGLKKDSYLDLETSMGNINLEIPNLVFTTNKQINLGIKKIIAHSINYKENEDHLKFIASTSNGSIKIS